MSFESLGLSAPVLQAVTEKGYTQPTPIQEKAIPIVLMGRDVLGCAQTGTGKTASFVLPMIDILAGSRGKMRMPRSLILEPTRELAAQVAENFDMYGKYNKLSMALLIGGVSFDDQERALEKGVDVLIATPGRLLDHFERGKVLLNDVKVLVIDEADRMLDMGFIPDVERIVGYLPKLRQMTTVPLTHGEEWGQRWDFHKLVENHDIDYIRATLPNVGGITEMMKIAAICETHAVGIIPHFTGPIATAALVNCLGTFPGPVIMEYNYGGRPLPHLPCQAGQRWEWDGVRFSVLHPRADALADEPSQASHRPAEPNAHSCVLRVQALGPVPAGQPSPPSLLIAADMGTGKSRCVVEVCRDDDLVVIVAGSPPGTVGSTNMVRVHRLGSV